MENQKTTSMSTIIMGIVLAIGIIICGFFIGKGFYSARINQPYITVKGLASRTVKADLAVWTITYVVMGDDITTANNELYRQQDIVARMVSNAGFTDKETSFDQIKITDRYASQYSTEKPVQRYLLKGTLRIRSNNVDLVKKTSQSVGELIKQGIVLADEGEELANPSFYFTQLNSIRPGMLSESTNSAFTVASQFAHDTRSHLGRIRRANQGVFEITSLDAPAVVDANNSWQIRKSEQASIYKKVRLVSTLDYFLLK